MVSPTDEKRIKEIRFFYSADKGQTWELAAKVRPDQKPVDFTAPHDGLYWFALQTIGRDGTVEPKSRRLLKPGMIVRVDGSGTKKKTISAAKRNGPQRVPAFGALWRRVISPLAARPAEHDFGHKVLAVATRPHGTANRPGGCYLIKAKIRRLGDRFFVVGQYAWPPGQDTSTSTFTIMFPLSEVVDMVEFDNLEQARKARVAAHKERRRAKAGKAAPPRPAPAHRTTREVPLGSWKRVMGQESVTLTVSEDGLRLLFIKTDDGETQRVNLRAAECHLSKDGTTLYGIFLTASVDGVDGGHDTAANRKIERVLAESPFSLRFRVQREALVVNDFRIGVREGTMTEEFVNFFCGTYKKVSGGKGK